MLGFDAGAVCARAAPAPSADAAASAELPSRSARRSSIRFAALWSRLPSALTSSLNAVSPTRTCAERFRRRFRRQHSRRHPVDLPARAHAQVTRAFAFPGFADVVYVPQRHAGLARPIDDVGCLETEPLVKSLIGRQTALPGSEVPLAEHRRAVAGVAQHLGDRDFPGVQTAGRAGCNRLADA